MVVPGECLVEGLLTSPPAYVTYTRSAFEMLREQGAASLSMGYPLLSFRIKFLCCALVLPIFFSCCHKVLAWESLLDSPVQCSRPGAFPLWFCI